MNYWLANQERIFQYLEGDKMVNGYDVYGLIDRRLRNSKRFKLGWDEFLLETQERIPREFIIDISKVQ